MYFNQFNMPPSSSKLLEYDRVYGDLISVHSAPEVTRIVASK